MSFEKFRNLFVIVLKATAVILTVAVFVTVFYPGEEGLLFDNLDETLAEEQEESVDDEEIVNSQKKERAESKKKLIALTFDDGPKRGVTNRVLDILEKNNAKATFFVIGKQVKENSDILKRAVTLGCEIGNHTWEHTRLTNRTKNEIHKTMNRTKDAVKKYTGYEMSLVRPTYGELNKKVRDNIAAPLIYWCVDTEDWRTENSKKIQEKVYGKVREGDIVLMHDVYPETADAVEKIVPYLKKKGYELVTISEMMKARGVKLESRIVYYSGRLDK